MTTEKFVPVYTSEIEEFLRKEFQDITKDKTYLDHAGAALYSPQQIKNIHEHLAANLFANPHSKSTISKTTEDLIDAVRYQILDFFNTTPSDYTVIFTSGATGALKLVGETFSYDGGQFVYLEENHTSVLGMREYVPHFKSLTKNEAFSIFNRQLTNESLTNGIDGTENKVPNNLFIYPAQCNFSGFKYPLEWIEKVHGRYLSEEPICATGNSYVLLDAASFVATSPLDLSKVRPDFVCISFYKIFGYPTGLGALLVKNTSGSLLKKRYFGGGSVYMALASCDQVVHRESLHEKFEDGTIAFLSIAALKHGFATLHRCQLNMQMISEHVFRLGKYVYHQLKQYVHYNNAPVCVLYHDGEFSQTGVQGGIVNFNVLRADGSYIGFAQVMHMANLYNISLRTGCFCNPGACQRHLNITSEEVRYYYEMGHVCGDQRDLIDGKPTGSVRISFGYMSQLSDAETFLKMIRNCFVEISETAPTCQIASLNHENNNINIKDNNKRTVGTLENIFIYPIKSCAAYEIKEAWRLMDTGLQYDRQWMIINRNGTCLTQKHTTRMCMIKPIVDVDRGRLLLTFEGYDHGVTVDLEMNSTNYQCHSKVCGDKIQGWDCGDEVAQWLDEVLCEDGLRLLRQFERTIKNDLQLSLVNKAQFLLINKASVQWLSQRIPAGEIDEDLMDTVARFRPNLLIDFGDAFIENDFEELYISDHKFTVQGQCTRCQMICIDQRSGEKTVEPLRTLSQELQGRICFGIYLQMVNDTPHSTRARITPAMETIAYKHVSSAHVHIQ